MARFLHWYMVPALIAVASHTKEAQRSVTPAILSSWAETDQLLFPAGVAELALAAFCKQGWCTSISSRRYSRGVANEYQFNAVGLQVAWAAYCTLPGGPAPDVHDLATRVWNLLRIRRRLTADEAAQTLVDADADYASQKKRIAALLAAWGKCAPRDVAVALKREQGSIRYVLQNDLGRWPPPSKPGHLHPTYFMYVQATPARFLKPARALEGSAL